MKCADCKFCFFADPLYCDKTGEEIYYYDKPCDDFEPAWGKGEV